MYSYAPRAKEKGKLHRCTRQVVEWAMAPAIDRNSSAVAEVCQAAKKAKGNDPLFSIPVNPGIGSESWDWPILPRVVQKPVEFRMFVGEQASTQPENIFTKGAHMPLMIFFWLIIRLPLRTGKATGKRRKSRKTTRATTHHLADIDRLTVA